MSVELRGVHIGSLSMNSGYHERVLYTVSIPWALRITIKSIVGHISTIVTESNLELQMVKLPAMVSTDALSLSPHRFIGKYGDQQK